MNPISAILNIGGEVIDRLWPDPATRDKAKLDLLTLAQKGQLQSLDDLTQLNVAQAATNTAEANKGGLLNSWRAGLGWMLTAAIGWHYIIYPIVGYIIELSDPAFDFAKVPALDITSMINLLLGMLGLVGMHVYEHVATTGTPQTK